MKPTIDQELAMQRQVIGRTMPLFIDAVNAVRSENGLPVLSDGETEGVRRDFLEFALSHTREKYEAGSEFDLKATGYAYIRAHVQASRMSVTIIDPQPEKRRAKSYRVGLVGEQFHQDTVADLEVGSPIAIHHEVGNPHDVEALVALDKHQRIVGYVSKNSWLLGAVHDQKKSCIAKINSITRDEKGGDFDHVVLMVDLVPEPISTVAYSADR